ncbi:MAG: amidohydrolase family protein [Deltaproteobacteria bacterium]|nr:amidohydrolase family protein [Deltaproteobacteria bacterium]MBI3075836.1 amidohydrolase family protein [Deltaproteobacteria bacterium]
MRGMQVIDADGHVRDRESDIRPNIELPYRNRRGSLVPGDEWDSSMYGRLGMDIHDVPTRLRDMDQEGIDVSVLFPTVSFSVSRLPERDYAAAYCRGYNNWIAGVCRESPRLKGVGLVPFQHVPAAVAEVTRAITELGLSGIAVGAFGLKEHLGSETFWPIYEEIQRLNVPLLIHNSRQGPAGDNRFDTFLFKHTVGRPVETLIDCAALVYGGVPEKFPRLRVAFLECGVGWVPYWMERMDEEYEKRQEEAPLLKAKPSEYMTSGNWFYACEPEEGTLPYAIDRLGEDVVVFASDYPHWDGMFPYVVSTIRERKDLSDSIKRKILGGNAVRLYGWSG